MVVIGFLKSFCLYPKETYMSASSLLLQEPQQEPTVEIIQATLEHQLSALDPRIKLLLQFRLGSVSAVPSWLPRREKTEVQHYGKMGIKAPFIVRGQDSELHSVLLNARSFFDHFHVANAYWEEIETLRGLRPVINVWMHKTQDSINPNEELIARSIDFLRVLIDQTWDYVNAYVNPGHTLAVVCKGGSNKRVNHIISMKCV